MQTLRMTLAFGALPLSILVSQEPGWRTDFSRHSVPLEEIVPGGPPKDGIPAIDRPTFVSVREADRWLADREPVIVVELEGAVAVRAYPLQILMWHEIVNDEVSGVPIAVTYCPLCNTALAFDRRHQGRVLDFGTTGRLRHSDLVMYDRQTESWWQQATGEAIVGALTGTKLRFIPAPLLSWREFKKGHPDGRVLSRDTGFDRPYGRNPYLRYDETRARPYLRFFPSPPDGRLAAMERVATVVEEDEAIAVPFRTLAKQRVVHQEVKGRPVVILWAPGTASAVDQSDLAQGRDVGSTAVYDRRVDGRTLTFEVAGGAGFRDRETGTLWSLLGRALSGPLAGKHLTPVAHGTPFWFAWAAFRPDTRIVR